MLHYTMLHCVVLHFTMLHFAMLNYIMLHCVMLHYTMLHRVMLHYTMLHHITSTGVGSIWLIYSVIPHYIRWSKLWVGRLITGIWTALRTTCSRSTRERTWTELSTTPRASCIMCKLSENIWVHVTLLSSQWRREGESLGLSPGCMWCLSGEKTEDRNIVSSSFSLSLTPVSLVNGSREKDTQMVFNEMRSYPQETRSMWNDCTALQGRGLLWTPHPHPHPHPQLEQLPQLQV